MIAVLLAMIVQDGGLCDMATIQPSLHFFAASARDSPELERIRQDRAAFFRNFRIR